MELRRNTTIQEMLRSGILSKRAHNVCGRAGLTNFMQIHHYYRKRKRFTDLYNSGDKVSRELTELCKTYEPSGEDSLRKELPECPPPAAPLQTEAEQKAEEATAEAIYQHLRAGLSRRANNWLLRYLNGTSLAGLAYALRNSADYRLKQLLNPKYQSGAEVNQLLQQMETLTGKTMADRTATPPAERTGADLLVRSLLRFFPCPPNGVMYVFLQENFMRLPTGEFPLPEFLQLTIDHTTALTDAHKEVFLKLSDWYATSGNHSAGDVALALGYQRESVLNMFRKRKLYHKVLKLLGEIVAAMQPFGFIVPARWVLPPKDYHLVAEELVANTPFTLRFAADLLVLLNPDYEVVTLTVNKDKRTMLFAKQICAWFNVAAFSVDMDKLYAGKRSETQEFPLPACCVAFTKQALAEEEQAAVWSVARQLLAELYYVFPDADSGWQIDGNVPVSVHDMIYKMIKERNKPCTANYISKKLLTAGIDIKAKLIWNRIQHTRLYLAKSYQTFALKEWETEGD